MILIVDDKKENLFSLKSLLQLNGYEVDTAISGEEALKKILKQDYALIILDVQMPDMDGYEVAESVKGYSKTKNIPILFLSAVNIDKRFITRGYSSGGVDYITKPFDPDLLLLKVNIFYQLYKQTSELNRMKGVLEEEILNRKEAQKQLEQANSLLEEKVLDRTRELLKTNSDLEVSNSELQQYAFLASHDLQEPLRKIITFLGIIQDRYIDKIPEAAGYFKKVINSTERMRVLINDLLKYSKLTIQSDFVLTDLNVLLAETKSDLEVAINEKHAIIKKDHLPTIEVIPGQIKQVFQNILSNALKFTSDGRQSEINIKVVRVDKKTLEAEASETGRFVKISINDNGIGFNEMYIEKIFTMFQRLHGKQEYEGTGIGLAIVKKIIEKHHGFITALSEPGTGATFIIILPISQSISFLKK